MCRKISDIVIGGNRTAKEGGNYGYKKRVSKESHSKIYFTLNRYFKYSVAS